LRNLIIYVYIFVGLFYPFLKLICVEIILQFQKISIVSFPLSDLNFFWGCKADWPFSRKYFFGGKREWWPATFLIERQRRKSINSVNVVSNQEDIMVSHLLGGPILLFLYD